MFMEHWKRLKSHLVRRRHTPMRDFVQQRHRRVASGHRWYCWAICEQRMQLFLTAVNCSTGSSRTAVSSSSRSLNFWLNRCLLQTVPSAVSHPDLFMVTVVGLTSIKARTTVSEVEISSVITYVHHDCRVLVYAVDVIAGIVACTGCLLATHYKFAAVTRMEGSSTWIIDATPNHVYSKMAATIGPVVIFDDDDEMRERQCVLSKNRGEATNVKKKSCGESIETVQKQKKKKPFGPFCIYFTLCSMPHLRLFVMRSVSSRLWRGQICPFAVSCGSVLVSWMIISGALNWRLIVM